MLKTKYYVDYRGEIEFDTYREAEIFCIGRGIHCEEIIVEEVEEDDPEYINDEWDEDDEDYDEDLWTIENREYNKVVAQGLGLR